MARTNSVYPWSKSLPPSNCHGQVRTCPCHPTALDLKNTEIFLNQQFTDGREKTVLFGFHCVDPATGKEYRQDRGGWYKPAGKGWVFYYQAGHRASDFEHPAYLQILHNTLAWQPGT